MRKTLKLSREQKYRLTLFALLALSSLLCLGLFAARATTSDSNRYAFLVWNLFLAWLPFGFAWLASTSTRLPKAGMIALVSLCAGFWLIFFPNSLYILTDFQHLAKKNTEAPIWYDVLMLLWFSWTGLLLGIISLHFMQTIVARWLGNFSGWAFVVGVAILSSLGLYVGRFLRWNSWDLFFKPLKLPGSFLSAFSLQQERTLAFSFLFTLFFLFVYVTLHIFGRLVSEPLPQADSPLPADEKIPRR